MANQVKACVSSWKSIKTKYTT